LTENISIEYSHKLIHPLRIIFFLIKQLNQLVESVSKIYKLLTKYMSAF